MNCTQNNKIAQVSESTLVIGVDIGSEWHFARAFDWRGVELTRKVFRFSNTLDGYLHFEEWIKDGSYIIPYMPEGIYAEVRPAVTSRDQILKELNTASNRIQRWLKIHFPEYLGVYKAFDSVSGLLVLEAAPQPEDVIKLGVEGVNRLWREKKLATIKGVGIITVSGFIAQMRSEMLLVL